MIRQVILLFKYLPRERHWQFYWLIILMFLSSLLEIFSIGAVVPFLTAVTSPETLFEIDILNQYLHKFNIDNIDEIINITIILFILMIAISGLFRLILLIAQTKFSNSIGGDMSIKIFEKTFTQDYEAIKREKSSEIISGISQKINRVTSGVLSSSISLLSSSILALTILISFFYINFEVAISTLLMVSFFYFVIVRYTRLRVKENSQISSKFSTKIISTLQEVIGGYRDIILDNNRGLYLKIFSRYERDFRKADSQNLIISSSPKLLIETFSIIMIALAAYYININESITLTSFIPIIGAIVFALQKLLPELNNIYKSYTTIRGLDFFVKDIFLLLEKDNSSGELVDSNNIEFKKSIAIKDLSFRYSYSENNIINNLSIEFKKGDILGLRGKTGSGKSTLLDIVMGLLRPSNGDLYVDGVLLDKNNISSWYRKISHVPQNIFLTDTTIAENIAFGEDPHDIDMEKVRNVSRIALVDDFALRLPLKYHEPVGENGSLLSGGQRQRIAIARALYKNSEVLILDEATSALDKITEKNILSNILKEYKKMTIIIVSHQEETLAFCNKVYSFEGGKLLS